MKAFVLVFFLLSFWPVAAQQTDTSWFGEITAYQEELNREFADSASSPLTKEDRAEFTGLEFYPTDSSFRVVAVLERTPDARPFEMPTSTDRLPTYRKYAEAHFHLNGRPYSLSIYQNLGLMQNPAYKDYLFLPFTDLTNGFGTYGGGRYLNLRVPEGDSLIIDFNKAYNPYCAYNHKYSCPIPPKENHLDAEIRAGVKDFHTE